MRSIAAVLLLAQLAAPTLAVQAEQPPALQPTRDVSVTYRISRAGEASDVERIQVSYADHDQRVRLEFFSRLTKKAIGAIIYDATANHVLTLVPAQGVYYEVPATGRANPGVLLSDKMRYIRAGSATVAGLSCTEWQVTNGRDFQGTACITADGVALRATRSKPDQESLEAVLVRYGTPPDALFEPGPELHLAPAPADGQ
ncbi:MAG: hypothetical protein ACREFU_05075 [Acetobacteraceae bacterium]